MDRILEALVDFAASAELGDLPESALRAATCRYLDSVGCAAGAFEAEPCRVARLVAATATSSEGVSAFGVARRTTPEYATFANGSATRYLDYNDGYAGSSGNGGVHPSDAAPAVIGAVEMMGGSGQDVLLGLYIVYEIATAIADEIPIRAKGWDQGANLGIAAAAATARLLGLDHATMGHAIALSITPNMPLHVTRTGELSHWKGCAGPQAAADAVWATRLAKAGMTGPTLPFVGKDGFCDAVGPIALSRLGHSVDGRFGLERAFTKALPACGHALAPVEAVMRLRRRVAPDEIAAMEILTYRSCWQAIGGGLGDAEMRWDPKNRESADHSLPYLAAIALADGTVGLDSYEPDRITDPSLRPLMNRIAVRPDDVMERRFQERQEMTSRIVVRLRDGSIIEEAADTSRGKPDLPMSADDFTAKFMTMAPMVLPAAEVDRMLGLLWNLGDLETLDELTGLYRRWDVQ